MISEFGLVCEMPQGWLSGLRNPFEKKVDHGDDRCMWFALKTIRSWTVVL